VFFADEKIVFERWPNGARQSDMKFKLVYDGPLPSEQRGPASSKHGIRKQLHPQLKLLWEQHPTLANYVKPRSGRSMVDKIGEEYANGPFRFVPLVRRANWMACRLEILVLMRQPPYQIFTGSERGDLDNRIKTLIDGLKRPGQLSECAGAEPAEDENPFFCLLEDDSVIYELNVAADRLLAQKRPDQVERDVVAVIGVHITHSERFELSLAGEGFGLVTP
jgi:hypothetical protein